MTQLKNLLRMLDEKASTFAAALAKVFNKL